MLGADFSSTEVQGFMIPNIHPSEAPRIASYFAGISRFGKPKAIVAFVTDGMITILCELSLQVTHLRDRILKELLAIYYLTRSKNRILPSSTERSLIYRILLTLLESM